MKIALISILCLGILILADDSTAQQGLPTRDQTPLLQSYFIPAQPTTKNRSGWSQSHALYITNTYQIDGDGDEDLLIDVENTRYDLQINYSQELWHFNINISLISNRSGFLDQTIEGWHDVFGLPQGGRDNAINDQIDLSYQRNGNTIIDSQQETDGVGDIQLATGYQISPERQIWFAVEIPSGSRSEFISNQAVDTALWYRSIASGKSGKLHTYNSIGMVFPADDGFFKGILEKQFLFAHIGLNYDFHPAASLILQVDYHSPIVKNSDLDALGHSIQGQFGLRFSNFLQQHTLELFFSEDIFPGHAPDITFGLRIYALSE